MEKEIGLVVKSSPATVYVIAYEAPQVASYLYSETQDVKAVMVVTGVESIDEAFSRAFDSSEARMIAKYAESSRALKIIVRATPVIDLKSKKRPQTLIPPRTPVYAASRDVLEEAFSVSYSGFAELYSDSPPLSWIRIGVLRSHPNVEVKVNVDAILSKHLAVLGSTGSGKSNMVAILVDRIAGLGGQVIIIDAHAEYSDMKVMSRGSRLIHFKAKINPLKMSPSTLASMLISEPAATKQRSILRKAIRDLNALYLGTGHKKVEAEGTIEALVKRADGELELDVEESSGKRYLKGLYAKVMDLRDRLREDIGKRVFEDVLFKIGRTIEEDYDVYSTDEVDPVDQLGPGTIVDVDISPLPDAVRDEVVAYVCRQVLQKAMTRKLLPTLIVLEEAHLYLKSGHDTPAKQAIERIAREGRKYGVGLLVVSQRPRGLDPDVLSQINSLCILRIMQPEDQNYVKQYSEWLTEEMIAALPTLERGEAILVGEWVRMPVAVLIDKHEGKRRGATLSATKTWIKAKQDVAEQLRREDEEEAMIKSAKDIF
ncbi:MAG: ATP-binding protein [Candidatus Nezhaarchaeota archaeon]|nr:ATP-binding protein [Candidatus Nezhaarchaeota archaeon]MCX8142357.1 ATP-binding protein [Candidatus Nezhaarchaeota archaeon]MDW8050670.1 ATP-binding protein [Nitrososphaerota archaeon]